MTGMGGTDTGAITDPKPSRKTGERPVCHTCGKPLKRWVWREVPWHAGSPKPTSDADGMIVTYSRPPVLHETGHVRFWAPSDGWGYNGDSIFCSEKCGYKLGLDVARRVLP